MADPRTLADDYVNALAAQLGDRLRSAALFGSAARGEWIEGVSDVNVLVLVDDIDATLLERSAEATSAAVERGVMPLLMELDEWRRAGDVFCIELADMRDAHIALRGEDPAAHYNAVPSNLRLQAERELRAKLLHLHGGMLAAARDRVRLGQLLLRALPSFVTYLRAALRLAGEPVPATTPSVIERGSRLAGIDPTAFTRVHEARTGGARLELNLNDPIVIQFNTSAEQLAAHIDAQGR